MKNRYYEGQTIRYHYDDFDGIGNVTMTVTKVADDYILAENDGITYRIEEGFNEQNVI